MKTHFIRILFLFVVSWVYLPIYAQQSDTLYLRRGENGKIRFASFAVNENSDRKMQNDMAFLKSVLQMKNEDELRLKSITTDESGITRKRFQQYYKGVIVEKAQYLLHGKNGNIDYINGSFQVIDLQSVEPILNEQQALRKALEYVGAEKYKWEDLDREKFIRQHTNDPNATYYPKGELVIARGNIRRNDSFKLSWKFAIASLHPNNDQMIYVDAMNGEIIKDHPLIINANFPGTAQTLYSGTQDITCDSYFGVYRLYESRNTTSGNSVTINTLNRVTENEISNANTNWTSGNWANFSQYQSALDVHWGMEKVIDYFTNVHNRNGIDTTSTYVPNIKSYVFFNARHANAGWWPYQGPLGMYYMEYGDGDGIVTNPWTSLDIVAHEIGHGITQFSSELDYSSGGESGPLNEGFSDIWSVCVKNYVNSTMGMNKSLWLSGSEIMIPNNSWGYNCVRDLQNPKSCPVYSYPLLSSYARRHPDTYEGENWDPGNHQHINSTILSHWFYILSVGKSDTNDNNDTYNVTGIGINKAEQIAYKTLVSLYPDADYAAARDASIEEAGNLYSVSEVIEVTNAWYAVGVGDMYPTIFGADDISCKGSEMYTLAGVPSGAYVAWTTSGPFVANPLTGNPTTVTRTRSGNGTLTAKDVNGNTFNSISFPSCTVPTLTYSTSPVSPGLTTVDNGCGDIIIQNVTVNNGVTLHFISCGDITVNNVTVVSGAKLILDAAGEVTINEIDVRLGAELDIK